MSGTVVVSKATIRKLMRDLPISGDTLVDEEVLSETMDVWYKAIGAILGYADTWTLSAVALVNGQREYTLGSTEYQSISMVRRTEDGVIMHKGSMEDVEARFQSTVVSVGDPVEYTLYEDATGIARLRLYPAPNLANAQHLDVFFATTEGTISGPADTIALSRVGLKAFEAMCAGECLGAVHPERLKQRGISPTLAQSLTARGQMMLDTETERRAQLRRTDSVRRMRF